MRVLGINDGHNASACLYVDGRVVAAVQEERLCRVKNWAGFPVQSVELVCKMHGITPRDVDFVAMNGRFVARPMTRDDLMQEYQSINDFTSTMWRLTRRSLKAAAQATPLYGSYRSRAQRERLKWLMQQGVAEERVVLVEHHAAHAAAAYHGWGKFDEDVLVLTCDGAGDGLCATVSVGRDGRLTRLAEVPQADSIANIYAMITFLMGMVPLEHEYKLMGMAPYADPAGADRVYRRLRALVDFEPANPMVWGRRNGCPETYCSYRFLKDLLERQRFDWIAGGLQRFTEEMLTSWVRNCVESTGIRRVALSGGIFMNVKANKLILDLPVVEDLFVYPSCGDETNAMGAAYHVYAERCGAASMHPLGDMYWGPEYDDEEIGQAIRAFRFTSPVDVRLIAPIEPTVGELLAEGHIVARFKGREEFGARALGNRSILANPRDYDAIRVLNEAIKSRDFWMPFAGSVLAEESEKVLHKPKNIPAPYMILTFDSTDRWREFRSATHPYDRTIRPQEVRQDWNPDYHAVISEFARRTGTPIILNTSFNLHGFPIVSRPEDALDVLDRSGLTHLAIGNWLVTKQ